MKIPGSAICVVRKVVPTQLNQTFGDIPLRERPVAIADQVHGRQVHIVTSGGFYVSTDGFVTDDPNIVLAIRVADCVPIIMRNQTGSVRGLIHAGRGGISSGIVESAINAIRSIQDSADPISVFLGPHIGPCCYRFPVEHPVGRQVMQQFPDGSTVDEGTVSLDLAREILARIQRSGFDIQSFDSSSRCTACSPEGLPSHRREGPVRTRTLLIVNTNGTENKEITPMAVDPELLKILACPETKEPVHLAPASLVDGLNELIDKGAVKNRGGDEVTERIDAGLVREDQRYLYPIRDDIPIMLIEEAIELPSLDLPVSD